ncbi:hypothetical protein RHGRI_018897 [Rhododendron griersonianum]|uniref:Peroxidase n=1 Tax=Rhododendron griersonianum TaxID=479676 RepID=A0AAV6K3H6_9ERIC|nr:hypothetical protein RHGRI_018897 [Rhododendron griersonianum]
MSSSLGHRWDMMAMVLCFLALALALALAKPVNVINLSPLPLDSPSFSPSGFPISFLQDSQDTSLQFDFYRETCPSAERIIRSRMARILNQNKNATAQLLRLVFHDCFIQGCDASVLLDDSNGNNNQSTEKDAIPNSTLKGFDFIDAIKEELEDSCPGIVSCSDILVVSTRDSIVLAGGPFYPLFTGRRDSNRSYYATAMAEIPKPDANISETLRLFSLRGFSTRETVALLGGHNIGKIGCEFIRPRLHNFHGTGQPDPTIPSDFLDEMSLICSVSGSTSPNGAPSPVRSRSLVDSAVGSSVSAGSVFGKNYYDSVLRGRGLLFADQQLMAHDKTADLVRAYASDDGATFRMDFARAMVKMSNFGVLTGSQGQVRINCSRLVSSN